MDEPTDTVMDHSVEEDIMDDEAKENTLRQSSRKSSKRGRGVVDEEVEDVEKAELRSSRRSKKTRGDESDDDDDVKETIDEEQKTEEVTNGNHNIVSENENVPTVELPSAQDNLEGNDMATGNDDEVVEVDAPEKKPDMIVLDDINDDDGPGPDEVPTAEERGFWKAVEENPNDFASWTYLLQVVEKNGKLKQIQKAFSSFLALYPYCYGYWKKYADQMKKIVSNEAAFEVYNEAVVAIPLSVDLWTYFIHFIAEWKEGDEDEIRTIYQRAVEACGQDYRSDKIWEAFVEWEKQTDKYRVLKLYRQFLACVIQRHQYHFDKFREWIFFTPVKDMVTMEDIKELLTRHKAEAERRRIETEQKIKEEEERARLAAEEAARLEAEQRKQAEEEEAKIQADIRRMQEEARLAALGQEASEMDDQPVPPPEDKEDIVMQENAPVEPEPPAEPEPSELEPPVQPEQEDVVQHEDEPGNQEQIQQVTEDLHKIDMEEPLPDSPDALTAKQEAAIREQMLLEMAPVHEKILAEIEEVSVFEDGIKRPYFHVKELERVQLKNWKNYLNLIIEKKDTPRTIILFERCLIACAFYEGFWIKYINFMNNVDKEETSRIYRRACMVHLVKKPSIHLNWAAFEEERGNLEIAREALDHIDKGMPGLISVIMRRAGLERRSGNVEQGRDIINNAIESCRGREAKDFWVMKYVSYLQYVTKDVAGAKTLLEDQIEKNPKNKRLYVRLLELEHSSETAYPDTNVVNEVFNKALASTLTPEEKAGFSHRRITYLEEFGDDISTIIAAYDEHNKNWKTVLDEKKKESLMQTRDYKRRDNNFNNTTTHNNRNYNRDRGYNRDRNYNQSNNYNQNNNYNQSQGYNMNYNMQHAQQQQQQYQQWYSQYAQQQQQYAAQGQYQQPQTTQNRGY